MSVLTDDEIRALLDGATPGPWRVLDGKHSLQIHGGKAGKAQHWIANIKCESCPVNENPNSGLIAAAPSLAAEVLRLREALREADLQLAYLDERQPTGTTPAIRARIAAALKGTAE